MKLNNLYKLLERQQGLITPEVYSTAWLAMVPAANDLTRPAWPQALKFLRENQLKDGGWGQPGIYYAHERTLSTLTATRAFLAWGDPADRRRIARGLNILPRYARDLAKETESSIAFELLLPAAISEMERKVRLPVKRWEEVLPATAEKISILGSLRVDCARPRTWWFSMEMLPTYIMAEIDDCVLDNLGSVGTAPAATAAYLRALRLNGKDSPDAAAYLENVLGASGGNGVGVTWPIDCFELLWTIDNLRRAGIDPAHPVMRGPIQALWELWQRPPQGVSWNESFPVPDGDHTAVAYTALRWAGFDPSDAPMMPFWNESSGLYHTYLDERDPAVSTHTHALAAYLHNPANQTHRHIAERIADWIEARVESERGFNDKWHISPLYVAARLLPDVIGWRAALAQKCLDFVLENQLESGAWGFQSNANQEETAIAVLGLLPAWRAGLLSDQRPLRKAAQYLGSAYLDDASERLWIGKTLYQPVGVAHATILAALIALEHAGLSSELRPIHEEPKAERAPGGRSLAAA